MRAQVASGRFARDEVPSRRVYPRSYMLKSVREQADILRKLFPGIGDVDEACAARPMPPIMEGYVVIPRWESVGETYNEAVEKMLGLIAHAQKLYSPRDGYLGATHLRPCARTVDMFRKLGSQQKGRNLLVVPAQFGLRHRGRSVRRAREVFAGNEFGLGVFATGIMLLTHPERFNHYDDLWIDCAGDECVLGADGVFGGSPFWYFRGDEFRLDASAIDIASAGCGSATACL